MWYYVCIEMMLITSIRRVCTTREITGFNKIPGHSLSHVAGRTRNERVPIPSSKRHRGYPGLSRDQISREVYLVYKFVSVHALRSQISSSCSRTGRRSSSDAALATKKIQEGGTQRIHCELLRFSSSSDVAIATTEDYCIKMSNLNPRAAFDTTETGICFRKVATLTTSTV